MSTDQLFDVVEVAQQILSGEIEAIPETLVQILTEASDLFHNGVEEESFLTDAQYDELEKILRTIDPENKFLATIGSDVRGGKIDLPHPMGSLDQVYEGDTIKWIQSNGWEDELFVISDKQDGTSALNCHGYGGPLQISYSRGNGFQGADITRHMKRIKAMPVGGLTSISNCDIRLEVIMEDDLFAAMKARAEADGGRVYKNARNYVAGRMNASESPQEFYDKVQVIATSIVSPKMGKLEQFQKLKAAGYPVTPYTTAYGRELTDEFLIALLNKRREESKTAIDGIVIDLDNAELRASLRRNSSSINPMYSRKFKVGSEDNVAIAEVVKVHWNPSKAGYLKPRVEIKPVDLVGVTITYATGFNAKFIRDKLIGPGAKIQITRSGDVIPFIQKVVDPSPVGPQMPAFEDFGLMGWTEGDVDLVMLDTSNNKAVQLEIINGTFGATGINAPHIREGSIEKLYDAGFKTVASIVKASESELKKAVGDSAGSKIYEGLKTKLAGIELGVLAGATSLLGRGIGRRKMTKVCEALGDDCVLNEHADPELAKKIAGLEGFEQKTASTIVQNLPAFRAFLAEIDGYYSLVAPKEKVVGGDLEGLTVVFTGVRDKELEEKIVARSGTIGSSVNKNTTYLVAKDPTGNSSKLVKARDLIGEENVISIVEARNRWG
jgi:NAD-dependent DNA ligase